MSQTLRDERFWDRLARKYAKDPITDMAGYEKTLGRTRTYLHAGDRVLEFGCGTGTTALKLAPHVGTYVATDISGEMIAIAREKATAGGEGRVDFQKGTLDDAPWEDSSFDAILAFNAVHMLTDVAAGVAAVRRLLKPGGLFVSKTPCLGDANILIRMAVPVMQMIGKAPSVSSFTAARLENVITDAGFSIIERARHGSRGMDIRPFIVARRD
ncbi:class I SAM-dependent methyltransferase [Nitratireductor mangrovi]|uniref:Class I SAM-dependent methyltransferase n=1 Tax=Nitratireductor mangrovi TaxID=2599600 RepID=A0A5B8L2P8_9HYPH|nr:class I SAM-dependent methyltransferase [Nitratireductor mangrovi]QDZ02022.1 class I SAM-dependent methyltransferase [Nitratireductor mangrovi]